MNDSYSTKAVEDEAVCVDEKSEKAIPKTSPGSRLVQFALGMIGFGRYSVPTEKRRELDLFLTSRRRLKFGILFALFALYVLWGGTYLAMRIALQSFPPFLLSGIRFLIAGSILYVFLRARGGESPTRKQWIGAALVGILLLAGGNGGVGFAEQWVASGLASLGIAAVPLWAALFSGLFGRWPNRKEWLGQRPNNPEKSAAHSGTAAIPNDAKPDATHCSAKTTPPLPPASRRMPTRAAPIHCLRVGDSPPRARRKTYRIEPAIRKRIPDRRNGGKLCSAIRIARYVPPQRTYSANRANKIPNFNRRREVRKRSSSRRFSVGTL